MVEENPAPDTTSDSTEAESPKSRERVKLTGVFIVKDGRAKFVEVPTGIADELNIVALSGVVPQDTVISGSFQTLRKLKNGDPVVVEQRSLDKMKEKQI
jgi:HlyD family secretion protein